MVVVVTGSVGEQKAMDLFHEVYEDWRSRLGEAALETVKAVTMLSTVSNKLDGPASAIKWSKMEVQIREEVQGTLHPRTQQAKRNHANLIEAVAALNTRQRMTGEDASNKDGAVDASADGHCLPSREEKTKGSLNVKPEAGLDGGNSRMNALLGLVHQEATAGSTRNDMPNHAAKQAATLDQDRERKSKLLKKDKREKLAREKREREKLEREKQVARPKELALAPSQPVRRHSDSESDSVCNTLHTHCNKVQQNVTRCSTLHTHPTLSPTRSATHCNALKQSAIHCNTLQHTAHT